MLDKFHGNICPKTFVPIVSTSFAILQIFLIFGEIVKLLVQVRVLAGA